MATKKPALGRNLGVLLGDTRRRAESSATDTEQVLALPVSQLQAGKYQPRHIMDDQALRDLSESIKAQGVIQPIVVRPIAINKYEIIAGERRWRAARIAGLSTVPALVRVIPDQAAMAMALIENIQREDLNPIEEASALQRLIEEFALTHEQVAQAVGRSRAAVSNLLRLLGLAKEVRAQLERGELEMGHARALLALNAEDQRKLGSLIVLRELTVRQAESTVREWLANGSSASPLRNKSRVDPDTLRIQKKLSACLGTAVKVDHKPSGKGKIVIPYASLAQFEKILTYLQQCEES